MNTLSIRDHGDDNEGAVIRAALMESYVAPVHEDAPVEVDMYTLNSDDAPDDTMLIAFGNALMDEAMEVEVEPQVTLMKLLNERMFEHLNSISPVDQIVRGHSAHAEGGDLALALSTDIGESAPEIGEIVATTPQPVATSPWYTVVVEYGDTLSGRRHLRTSFPLDAYGLFWDAVERLIPDDPTHIYGQLITDAMTDEQTKDLIAGFVQWWDEDLDPAIPDGMYMPRGVYLYGQDETVAPLTEHGLFARYQAETGKLSSTPAGYCMGPLVENDNIWYMVTDHYDTNILTPTLERALDWFYRELLDLVCLHPTCRFVCHYSDNIMFGVELIEGDADWTLSEDDNDQLAGLFIEVSDSQRKAYENVLHESGIVGNVRSSVQFSREHAYIHTKSALGIDTGVEDISMNEVWESEDIYVALNQTELDRELFASLDMRIGGASTR